jgi:hypothetical protein
LPRHELLAGNKGQKGIGGLEEIGLAELDILCHCFWEMTWCGYAVDSVKQYREKLERISKEETKNLKELQLW